VTPAVPLGLDSLELPYFLIFTITPLVVALILFIYSSRALRRGALLGFVLRILLGVVFVTMSAGLAVLGSAMRGYTNLTQETRAARVLTRQLGEQHYSAIFTFPDGSEQAFELLGDQLYVDGYVLKWHPIANVMGFRTVYELDRVEGRYRSLDDTQTQPRTAYSLAPERPVDLFDLTERIAALEFLYDTEYGSATFVPMEDGAMYDVMVSTTGFLVRRLDGQ
jgi:hypothetical protein